MPVEKGSRLKDEACNYNWNLFIHIAYRCNSGDCYQAAHLTEYSAVNTCKAGKFNFVTFSLKKLFYIAGQVLTDLKCCNY